MPDWAIVLVAAFGGGLAGAVLQPVVGLGADILLSDRNLRKARERTLRRMVSARLEDGGRLIYAAADLHIRLRYSQEVPFHERRQLAMPPSSLPPWEPERIADPYLANLVSNYVAASWSLARSLFSAGDDWDPSPTSSVLRDLRPQIITRMDQLKWPEVDD